MRAKAKAVAEPDRRVSLNVRFVEKERQDFRKSDVTLFQEFAKREPAVAASLGDADAVVFVSRTGTRCSLVFGRKRMSRLSDGHGVERLAWASQGKADVDAATITIVMASLRLWVIGGSWDARMLVEYAEQAGIELRNRKRYEDFFREEEARRRKSDGKASTSKKG